MSTESEQEWGTEQGSVGGDERAEGATVTAERTNGHVYVEDLSVSYPGMAESVVDVDRIDLPRGEITALIGPNGSGKSTLLKTIATHVEPDTGSVFLDGREVAEYDAKAFARELGHLSQEHECPSSVSVEDLVFHGRYPHRGFLDAPSESDRAAVERAIELAGIDDLRNTEVGSLSGGQKQLVWIAMVLAQETDVLLLDEPTTYIDVRHQLRVLEVVQKLNDETGVTVGLVLHDIDQAARFADYVVAIDDGDLYDWGPPENVVTEAMLADVFGVDAAVTTDPDLHVVPKRPLDG
ncbi:ABC transporter ATP-binding protein [Halorientalis brevis]|uniref:Cobalamin import ATP-binding protein BtuD n=1 Tax=Halorientalis brevis TaxID=1126241 RepID=A0ABD6CEL4_9EURY|nr:ABC transporter ATP-binding protein [Halorientalis brevis]